MGHHSRNFLSLVAKVVLSSFFKFWEMFSWLWLKGLLVMDLNQPGSSTSAFTKMLDSRLLKTPN